MGAFFLYMAHQNNAVQPQPVPVPVPRHTVNGGSGGGGRIKDSLRYKRKLELEKRRRETQRILRDVVHVDNVRVLFADEELTPETKVAGLAISENVTISPWAIFAVGLGIGALTYYLVSRKKK